MNLTSFNLQLFTIGSHDASSSSMVYPKYHHNETIGYLMPKLPGKFFEKHHKVAKGAEISGCTHMPFR
jgi:hypothetical protein